MKKTILRFFCMVQAVLVVLCLCPAAMALPMDGELLLGCNYEERFYSNEPKTWSFTPKETGEYLLFTPSSGSLMGEIVGQSPIDDYSLQTGQKVQVFVLNAGTQYQIRIQLNPAFASPYSDVFQLDKKQPLQELVLNMTDCTGRRDDYNSIYVRANPAYYSLDGLTWVSSDPSVVSIESTEGNECLFRMNKVGTAVLTARFKNFSASCTVTVEKAIGYWDDYPVWPANQMKMEFNLPAGQGCAYAYTPSQSGIFAVYASGDVHVNIHGTSPSHILNEKTVQTMSGVYELVNLVAGETYVLGISPNYAEGDGVKTGVVTVEKARNAQSITLYGPNMSEGAALNGYVGGIANRFAMSDPPYAFGLNGGFRFTSSDEGIASLEQAVSEGGNNVLLTGEGSCKITVTTGSTSVVCPVTVKPSPVLEDGKTTKLTFAYQDAYGVTCLFTPEVSGNYTFTIKGSGGTCHIEDTQIGNYIEGSGSMGGWLQGGRTYRVILDIGNSDHTITVYGSGNKPPVVTPPPQGSDDPMEPPAPTEPMDPPDPSVPTDPIEPSEPSAPSEPADEPTEPDAPQSRPEAEELAEQLGGSYKDGAIHLAVQDGNVDLTAQVFSQLAQMNVDLVVKGEDVTVKLDHAALNAVANQSVQNVTLQIRRPTVETLREQQKAALKDRNVAGVIAIDLSCGDSEIHDFGGGYAWVTVPLAAEAAGGDYAVYYVSPEGSLEKMEQVSYGDGSLIFRTGHFSDYVIVRETVEKGEKQPNLLLLILLGAVAVAAVAVVIILRRKK